MEKDIEFRWEQNIKEAKQLVSLRNKNQMLIAGLALDVCEITWGGNVKEGQYTMKRFAKEIGVNSKTLSGWICIKKNVYDKLSPKDKEKSHTYTTLTIVGTKVNNDSSIKEVRRIFDDVTNLSSRDYTVQRYLGSLRSLSTHFVEDYMIEELSKKGLEEILFYNKFIQRRIKEVFPKIKEMDHGIAATSGYNSSGSASRSADARESGSYVKHNGLRYKITSKDRRIISYMKERPGQFIAPTEIGVKVGRHNPNSATAWACRTLVKLVGIEMVERNDKGHYRFLED